MAADREALPHPFEKHVVPRHEALPARLRVHEVGQPKPMPHDHEPVKRALAARLVRMRRQEHAERHARSGINPRERERQHCFAALAHGSAVVNVRHASKAVIHDSTVADLSRRAVEFDDVPVVSAHDRLDGVDNRALARARLTDQRDRAADLDVARFKEIPIMDADAFEPEHYAFPTAVGAPGSTWPFWAASAARLSEIKFSRSPFGSWYLLTLLFG
jgi:hypothetical protein